MHGDGFDDPRGDEAIPWPGALPDDPRHDRGTPGAAGVPGAGPEAGPPPPHFDTVEFDYGVSLRLRFPLAAV